MQLISWTSFQLIRFLEAQSMKDFSFTIAVEEDNMSSERLPLVSVCLVPKHSN